MRATIQCLFAGLLFLSFNVAAQNAVVGTFNLRYDNPADSGNLWKDRMPVVAGLIAFHNFDILGTQEGLSNQLDDLAKALPEYEWYGKGRDDGETKGEHSAIFFKTKRFELLDMGDFWLSQTPAQPSLGWDARCCKRICTWVYLKDRNSGKKIWVFNAHYDHEGKLARTESSRLILKRMRDMTHGERVVFMGDLNSSRSTDCYQIIATSGIVEDTYNNSPVRYDINPTFHAFGRQLQGSDVIDHIFCTKQFKVLRWGVLSDSYHGKYPSDHFPVLAELEL